MMRGLKYPTFSRTALDKWEWQEDAVDVASISIQNSDFHSLIKPEPLWPAECNYTVWNEWNLSKHMSEAGTDQCHLELIETTQTPLQRKISILVGGTELLLLQRKLNLPNIIRGKEYICIILTTKQWLEGEDSCGLPLWAAMPLMFFEWEVSVHLIFSAFCARNRSTLGNLWGVNAFFLESSR